jgi:ATP-dependent exoDNAse (exonuclease V) beta subunit
MVLRAVADPTNDLHIVSALRTPLLACGDDDLFRFRVERHGRWSYLADQPDDLPADDPVAAGLAYLRALYDERHWRAPSELLARIVHDRRALELGFAEGRHRDVWRRLRFVVDQARSWSEATGGNLREYLAWVDLQSAEGARVTEAVLPETDDDAVRIMTIHSAKGLEFPITVVSGMSSSPQGRRASAEVVFPLGSGIGYKLGKGVTTDEYESWAPIDEQMGLHERIRLLYVACTRARDHLVVSLHRKARVNPPQPAGRTNAELLVDGIGAVLDELPGALGEEGEEDEAPATLEAPVSAAPLTLVPFDEWEREQAAALERAARPTTVSATALTDEGERDVDDDGEVNVTDVDEEPDPGLEKRPRDLDLPPWLKGRYGTAVGRAVHGALQSIDLATGAGLDEAVAGQCEAEAVGDRREEVVQLVRYALAAPTVVEAAQRPHWREVYTCVPVGGRLLEGYVDLLYRGTDGLVVVDYKTAATSDPDELASRVEGYRMQGASYAHAIAASTGEVVSKVVFVFLTPTGPIEMELDSLDAAVSRVEELARL